MMIISLFSAMPIVSEAATTIKLYYQKNMDPGNYSASNSATMSVSSNNSNRYSVALSLDASSSYGFYIKWDNNYYKANANASTDVSVELYDYGSTNYGNSSHRVTYTSGSAATYVFTFDTSNNKVVVSPQTTSTCKLAWDVATDHDGNWNLDNYTEFSHSSGGQYKLQLYLQKRKYYMFIQIANAQYYKGTSELKTDTPASVYHYNNSNFGGSADKLYFTPGSGGLYEFTWNHNDKTLSVQKVAMPDGDSYKISDGITNKWDSNATNSMSGSGTTRTFTYYLKKTDSGDVYFRFYNTTQSKIFGAESNNTEISTSFTNTDYNRNNSFYIDRSDLPHATKFHEVVVTYDFGSTGNYGGVKYTATAKDDLTASLSVDNSSPNVDETNHTITFTGTAGNLFGSSAKYEYYMSSNNGTSYSLISTTANGTSTDSSKTWTPSTIGTYLFKVKITDTTVNTSTNAKSSRYVESDPITVNVIDGLTYSIAKQYQVNGGTVQTESVSPIGVSSNNNTEVYFDTYKTVNNVRYKLTGFQKSSNVTIVESNLTTGRTVLGASGESGAYIRALYASEADFRIFYANKVNYTDAWLWKSGTGGFNNCDSGFPGVALTSGAAQQVTGRDADYTGSIYRWDGNTQVEYYYYKTYNLGYDGLIFSKGSNQNQTTDIDISSFATGDQLKYYTGSAWASIPADIFAVTISATDTTPAYINSTLTGSETGTKSGDTNGIVKVNSTGANVTFTPPSGYVIDTTNPVTVSSNAATATVDGTATTSSVTVTVKATGNGATVSPNFVEIARTIHVQRKKTTDGGTITYDTISTTYTAGKKSTVVIPIPDAPTDYSKSKWSSMPSGVTMVDGTLNSQTSSITVKADNDATVTYEYTETKYNVAVGVNNTDRGTVKRGLNTITSTTPIGNLTTVALTAENNTGYEFDYWSITISGKTVKVYNSGDDSSNVLQGTFTNSVGTSGKPSQAYLCAPYSTLYLRANGVVTVTAYFKPVQCSIEKSFYSDQYTTDSTTPTNGNWLNVTELNTDDGMQGGEYHDRFRLHIYLANGYDLDSITFSSATGYAEPTQVGDPSVTGNHLIYTYQIENGNVGIVVKLKAKAVSSPTVTIEQQTGDRAFSNKSMNDNDTVNVFYKQPIKVKSSMDTYPDETAQFAISSASFTSASFTKAQLDTNGPVSLIPSLDGNANDSEGYVDYPITMTITNNPPGVDTAATLTRNYTIRVYYNTAQKKFFKMKNLYLNTIQEEETGNAYYENARTDLTAYNQARSSANSVYGTSSWTVWPAYNATAEYENGISTAYTSFFNSFIALQQKANTTTVYVLSKYNNSGQNKVSIQGVKISNSQTDVDAYNHFKQYHYYLADADYSTYCKGENVTDDHLMRYEGNVRDNTNSSTYYRLYSFTYAGHVKVKAYYTDGSSADTYTDARRISGTVAGLTEFKDYYINVYNKNIGNGDVTSASEYEDLHSYQTVTGKVKLETNNDSSAAKNKDQIKSLLNLTAGSSLSKAAPSSTIEDVLFKIQREPDAGTGDANWIDLLGSSNNTWTPAHKGKYIVKYQVQYKYGHDEISSGGATFTTKVQTYNIFVLDPEVTVMVDMNDNNGNPSLNFRYTDSNTVNNYLCSMELVSGSESIYAYTLDLKKLKSDYNISYKDDSTGVLQDININAISIDGKYYTQDGSTTSHTRAEYIANTTSTEGYRGFTVSTDSYSGEVWIKADSTNMRALTKISNASITNTFRASLTNGTVLPTGITRIAGTGIITDETDGIHDVQYAAYDGTYKFSYNVRVTAAEEITDTVGENTITYYFDHWAKCPTDNVEFSGETTTISNMNSFVHEQSDPEIKYDYNINSAPEYNDGNGSTTYVAVYKQATSSSAAEPSDVRVKITYKFKDFDTSDGEYEYVDYEDKRTPVSYTKVIRINDSYSTANDADYIEDLCENNQPLIKSKYFDYEYDSASITKTEPSKSMLYAEATMNESEHVYRISICDKTNYNTLLIDDPFEGRFQQTLTLDASKQYLDENNLPTDTNTGTSNPYYLALSSGQKYQWCTKVGGHEVVLAETTGAYNVRYTQDNMRLYCKTDSGSVGASSVISYSYSETYREDNNSTDRVRHNFYIVDYLDRESNSGTTLKGAGAIYATAENDTYNYQSARDNLNTNANIQAFIEGVLDGSYDENFKAQTINNIGFRYIAASSQEGKDKLRYSDELKGYHYVFGAQMNNLPAYQGQELRVFSFFVTQTGNTVSVIVSPYYAKVERYYNPQRQE